VVTEDLTAIKWELHASQEMVTTDIQTINGNQEEMKGMIQVWLQRMNINHE
jgi:hypothetical protein